MQDSLLVHLAVCLFCASIPTNCLIMSCDKTVDPAQAMCRWSVEFDREKYSNYVTKLFVDIEVFFHLNGKYVKLVSLNSA